MTSEPPVTFWLNKGPAAADERLAASTTAIAVPNVMLFMARILRSKAKLDCSTSRRRNAPQQALFSDGRDPAVRLPLVIYGNIVASNLYKPQQGKTLPEAGSPRTTRSAKRDTGVTNSPQERRAPFRPHPAGDVHTMPRTASRLPGRSQTAA